VTFGLGPLPWFFATLTFQFPISGRIGLIILGRPGGTPVWPVTSTGVTGLARDGSDGRWSMGVDDCDNPPKKIPYYHLNQSALVIKQ
jgi:hypothetical protein